MLDVTMFLSQLWGPVLVAVGLGVFISRSYYVKVYRDLEKEAFALLMFGMVAMTAGIVHIAAHNEWNTFSQMVISILGWGLFIKGAVCIITPNIVNRCSDWWITKKCIAYAGVFMLVLGAYLSWVGYLS